MASITDSDSSISSSLRRTDSQYLSDLYVGDGEDVVEDEDEDDDDDDDDDGDDGDLKEEFICPFCADRSDVVSLCCHIDDQHPLDANNGVCPVCAKRAGMDLFLQLCETGDTSFALTRNDVQHKRRFRKGGSNSVLRKQFREGNLQSLSGDSSYMDSSNCEPDPLLLSFIFAPVVTDEPSSAQPRPSEATEGKESVEDDFLERKSEQLQLSDKDQLEKARMFEFVHGLLMSILLDDNL